MTEKKCVICGKEFLTVNSAKILCGDRECKRQYGMWYKRKNATIEHCPVCNKEFLCMKDSSGCCSNKCTRKMREGLKTRQTKNAKMSFAEIDKLARAEGLSYGLYVALHGL